MAKSNTQIQLYLLVTFLFFQSIIAIDFVFNGFNSSDLLLFGNSTSVDDQSHILTLTNKTSFSTGRALYPKKIPTKKTNTSFVYPFSTSFIFAMAPYKNTLPGHGLVFIFTPFTGINGTSSAQHLGLFNFSNNGKSDNHVLGIEFDIFANQEFNDINDNHVGIDLNSLASEFSEDAGYWLNDDEKDSFKKLKLNSGETFQVWIDYSDSSINVTMAPAGTKRPRKPLMSVSVNLSEIFVDEMYLGFTSATGKLVQSHKVLAWSFSNSDFTLSERLITTNLPSFVLPKDPIYRSNGFILGISIGGVFVFSSTALLGMFLIKKHRQKARERAEMDDWEMEYWPHRITYQEIKAATNGFGEENVIGIGGNGKVYKGVLLGSVKIAVKRISQENNGVREFLAEISSIGRLKHRSLVGLRGWCKREKGSFMLVYDYMENGSLDRKVFDCDLKELLSYQDRVRILKDVAFGVLYLHEGWETKVLHRDIKASNVLLDKEMNGKLGDFGLARLHGNGQVSSTTCVVGTIGYLAPETIHSGRISTKTDVFGFGVLILEVMCGRRPIEDGKPPLIDWVWQMKIQGQLTNAIDERIMANNDGGIDEEEVERVLNLGLLCSYHDPNARPSMRQVVKFMEGRNSGVEEWENEDKIDVNLLQRLNSTSQNHQMGRRSSSLSLSWSNSIVTTGR